MPKAYLRSFVDGRGRGRVLVYRKDEPTKVLKVDPVATGFERYYYSQPTPEGMLAFLPWLDIKSPNQVRLRRDSVVTPARSK